MKLRILFSMNGIVEPRSQKEGLITLHRSEKLLIQGEGKTITVNLKNDRKVYIFGEIIGRLTVQGDIHPIAGVADLRELFENLTIEQCRNNLEGRFILVIVGPGNKCSVCSDRYGKRDLYYFLSGEQKCLTSDLSLFPDSPSKCGYDQVAMIHALCMYGYRSPKRHTPYKGVRRLGVLETVHINDKGLFFVTEEFEPIPTARYGNRELDLYADIFLESLKLNGSRNGNVVYLSSGWDSSSILAGLVYLFGKRKVRCVIGCMKYAERSGIINPFEIERAKAVADYYGVRLDIVDFDYQGKLALELYEQLKPLMLLPFHISGGAGFNHAILADYVAKTTNGNESVFVGEISDGAHNLGFSQFLTIFHPVQEFREYSDKMGSYLFGPTFFNLLQEGKHLEDPIYNLFLHRSVNSKFDRLCKDNFEKRTRQLLSSFFLRSNRIPLWSLSNIRMLTNDGAQMYQQEMESEYFDQLSDKITGDNLYSWYLHLYNSFHWQCSTIAPLGITSEIYGIKIVLPFWDIRIQEFLSAMPENWGRGLDLNSTKYPLKWMLKNRIDYPMHLNTGPHSYQYDVNPNFNLGAEMIYGSGFKLRFKEALKKKAYQNVLSPDFIDITYVDEIVGRYIGGCEVSGTELRDLLPICWLSLAGWYGTELT